ncbi:hypothetical protein [Desulfonatronum parangueonense]
MPVKPKSKRLFEMTDVEKFESILKSAEPQRMLDKHAVLMKLTQTILDCIRKGIRPAEIARILRDGGMSTRKNDILYVVQKAFEEKLLTEDEIRKFRLQNALKVQPPGGKAVSRKDEKKGVVPDVYP